jgi:hypothetical protein
MSVAKSAKKVIQIFLSTFKAVDAEEEIASSH